MTGALAEESRQQSGIPDDWDRGGLPGWTYFSEELHQLERKRIFCNHWQYVCHVSEVAKPGQFVTLDIANERGLVLRGHDGELRAFHNLCRHRGSRVVAEKRGTCERAIVCPYHGWIYNTDGSLRGIPRAESFPGLPAAEWGLKPIELEVWMGFVFIRFCPGPQPGVHDIMQPHFEEVSQYRTNELVPAEEGTISEEMPVNWKSVRDVDNEGYHVRQAHPGLHDLYGENYVDEPQSGWTSRSVGKFNAHPGTIWSVRHYRSILPEPAWLGEFHRNAWIYIGVFPNFVLGLYPDSVMYYQEIPLSATRTIQRGAVYRYRDETRAMRLARYLSVRIDRIASDEDRMLAIWSSEAVKSSGFSGVIYSDLEYGLRSFHDHLRSIIPEMRQEREPLPGSLSPHGAQAASVEKPV